MSFATKLSHITYADGLARDVMKLPKTDSKKISLPGEFAVIRDEKGVLKVLPLEYYVSLVESAKSAGGSKAVPENMLRVVYNHGRVADWGTFDDVRKRVAREWNSSSKLSWPISSQLQAKIEATISTIQNNK